MYATRESLGICDGSAQPEVGEPVMLMSGLTGRNRRGFRGLGLRGLGGWGLGFRDYGLEGLGLGAYSSGVLGP